MVRLKKELGYEPGCLDNEMNFHQNNFEYEFWAMLTGVDEPAETNNFGGKNLLRRMTDMQLALSCSKVEHSDLVLSLDTAKKEIENAQKTFQKAAKELEICNSELATLYEKESQYLTAMDDDCNSTRLNLLKRQIQIKEALQKNATENFRNAQTVLNRKKQELQSTEQNIEDVLLDIKRKEDVYGKINEKLAKNSHLISTETSITKAGNGT